MSKTSKRSSKTKIQVKKADASKRPDAQLKASKTTEETAPADHQYQEVVRALETGDTESYLRLRQALDSFHAVAIHYYACGETTQDRADRQQRVKQHVDIFLRQVLIHLPQANECPPGTRQCPGGDCIPVGQPCQ